VGVEPTGDGSPAARTAFVLIKNRLGQVSRDQPVVVRMRDGARSLPCTGRQVRGGEESSAAARKFQQQRVVEKVATTDDWLFIRTLS